MKKFGNYLERAEGSYGEAMKKLSGRRGNLIRRAEDMKGLKIANNKSLPSELVEKSDLSLLEKIPVQIVKSYIYQVHYFILMFVCCSLFIA